MDVHQVPPLGLSFTPWKELTVHMSLPLPVPLETFPVSSSQTRGETGLSQRWACGAVAVSTLRFSFAMKSRARLLPQTFFPVQVTEIPVCLHISEYF